MATGTGVAGLILGSILGGAGSSTPTTTTAPAKTVTSAPAAPSVEPAAVESPAPPVVTAANYSVTLKTLEKQCFGSAGCNVTVRVELGVDGPASGVDAEVTVEVTGDESGPSLQTVDVVGGQYDPPEFIMSTASSKTKIRAKVTAVEVR
jgi:hypothetical protein